METYYLYILAAIVIAGVAAAWYFTRGTEINKSITWVGTILMVVVVLIISAQGRIPVFGRILDWFRDRSDEKHIETLKSEITSLGEAKAKGLKDSEELSEEAEALRRRARVIRQDVEKFDSLVSTKMSNLNKVESSSLPEVKEDPVEEANNMMDALIERRSRGVM